MLNELLRKYLKKPTASAPAGQSAEQSTAAPAKKPASAKKSGGLSRDKKVFIGLCVLIIGGNTLIDLVTNRQDPNAGEESVIPLAQLTGKIGSKPGQETLEQQFRRENKNVPLPDGSAIPDDVLKSRTQLFRQVPFGDNELAYEMRLPTNWGQSRFTQYGSPSKEKYEVLTNIDRFFGPAVEDVRPFVWLEVERLQRLTTAELYLNAYFIKRGITPETIKVQDMKKAEALYLETRDYNTYVMRTLFVINGDRVMLVTFGVPINAYKTYRDLMGATLASYKMLYAIDRGLEPLESYKLLNVMTFNYPKRWQPRSENRVSSLNPSVEFVLPTELTVRSNEPQDQLNGVILVNGWRNNTMNFNRTVLEQAIVKRLKLSKLELADVLQPEKQIASSDPNVKVSQMIYVGIVDLTTPTTEEYGIIQDRSSFPRQEVWVTILDNGDYTAAVTLVTWPQTKNYLNWSYNVISYQTILDTLKLRSLSY